MKKILRYQKPAIYRRIFCMAFDVMTLIVLFFLFLVLAVQPIAGTTSSYKKSYNTYAELLQTTGLYVSDDNSDNTVSVITSDYDAKLSEYYSSKNYVEYTLDDYNKLKAEATVEINSATYNLFYDDGTGNYVEKNYDDATVNADVETERTTWYKSTINTVILEEINGRTITETDGTTRTAGNETLIAAAKSINKITILTWIISFAISLCITYLLFPMIFKDRATLGKKMFHFQVINAKTGFMASRLQVFARFVFFVLLNVVLGYLTIGISILVSIIMSLLTKNRITLHDMLASTMVVNNAMGTTSQNERDYVAFEYDDGREEPEESENNDIINYGETPEDESKEDTAEKL